LHGGSTNPANRVTLDKGTGDKQLSNDFDKEARLRMN
jgi:hypothetical protein